MNIGDLGNIPFRMSAIETLYPHNKAIAMKAKRLEDEGKIIRLKRGLYVAGTGTSGERINEFLVANHLHGPSYVSAQTALRYYGLIPENVYETISMTTGQAKCFDNPVGHFRYVHCSDSYFPIGITFAGEGNSIFLIATPEKALCDLIVSTPNLNLRYRSEITAYLEQNLRIDIADLKKFDLDILRQCAEAGKKRAMISRLIKILE